LLFDWEKDKKQTMSGRNSLEKNFRYNGIPERINPNLYEGIYIH